MTEQLARGYVRLSQSSERSIDNQIDDIDEYCDGHDDLVLDHVYNEGQYASGWDASREQYQQMLADAEAGEFDVLVVAHGSRLGRDKLERLDVFTDLNNKWGVEFHTCRRGYVDPSLPEDLLLEVFQSLSDDEGKGAEVERLTEAIEKKIENGHYHGHPPAGLTYSDDKLSLVPDPDNRDAYEMALDVLDLWDTGEYSYAEVADETGVSKAKAWRLVNDQREWYEAADTNQVSNGGDTRGSA